MKTLKFVLTIACSAFMIVIFIYFQEWLRLYLPSPEIINSWIIRHMLLLVT